MCAKKFTALYELFLPSDELFFSHPQPPVDAIWGQNRYKDEASKSQASLAEVYLVCPDYVHNFIRGHSNFNANVSCEFSRKGYC